MASEAADTRVGEEGGDSVTIEINQKRLPTQPILKLSDGAIAMVTPPIDEDYWLFRVKLSDNQAVVAFPKFGTFGIGFQHEDDWNTNLPYSCPAAEIWDHIKHNKGDDSIPDCQVVAAIIMLQDTIRNLKREAGVVA